MPPRGHTRISSTIPTADPATRRAFRHASRRSLQFTLVSLVGILVIVGFIYTTLNLIDRSIVHIIPPMLLPALAMCALAISDIRYLWLEHDAGTEGDDED